MAEESCRALIYSIDALRRGDLDNSMNNQLVAVKKLLIDVANFLRKVEKVDPENGISTELRALFLKAHDGFSAIFSQINGQSKTSNTFSTILRIIKLENAAKKIEASILSESTNEIAMRRISDILQIIEVENIADRIEASKPSRSSTRITMDMVKFASVLLSCFSLHHSINSLITRFPKIAVLEKKLKSLRGFLMFAANQCIEHEKMNHPFALAEDVAYTAAHLFILCLHHEMDQYQARVLDSEISLLMERIDTIRAELRQLYTSGLIELNSSGSKTPVISQLVQQFVIAVREDLGVLPSDHASLQVASYGKIHWLLYRLYHLSRFLPYLRRIPFGELKSLSSLVEVLVIEAAIVIYSFYKEEVVNASEEGHVPFLLQLKFNHVKFEIELIQLINGKSIITDPFKDLIGNVREELIFLRTFLMDPVEQCKEHTKITDVFYMVQSVTTEACSVIKYLSFLSKHVAEEINRLQFLLLLKFKLIKTVIGQMCPITSPSSAPNHSMMYLLNFLPINFEIIQSYFSMSKSPTTSFLGSQKMDGVLIGFLEYILENLRELLRDETKLMFNDTNEVNKFYHGVLLILTFLADPPVQYMECKKPNELLTEIQVVTLDAGSAINSFYEDAVDSNKCWKVNRVLQLWTLVVQLIKSERNLMDLLNHRATLEVITLDLIESAHEELVLLRTFLLDVLRHHTDIFELDNLLSHAAMIVHKAAVLSGFQCDNFMNGIIVETLLTFADFLQEFEPIKVKVREVCFQVLDASPCDMPKLDGEGLLNFLLNLMERELDGDTGSVSFLKDQLPVVVDKVTYLGFFIADIAQYRNMQQEVEDLMKRVEGTNFACFFSIKGYRPAWFNMLYISDVKQLLKFVEAEIKMICLKVPDSPSYSFPKTNGLGFLDCFLRKLEELLCSKIDSVTDLNHPIRSVKEGLLCLRDHFTDNYDEVYGVVTSVTEIAYKAEYVIDSCLACPHPLWYKDLWISEVVENIKFVDKIVRETCVRKTRDVKMHKVEKTTTDRRLTSSASTPRKNEEMEGFQEAMEKIKQQLVKGSSELDVVSLVGMAGIGKTTLAEKIYDDLIVTRHFDVHAKCRVTQVYSWRELLLTILNDILEPVDRSEKGDGELADELRRLLLPRRFLILIDDVWDNKVWENLHMCFRGNQKGSRIILTTRLSDVASYAQCKSEPHHLCLFTDDESWTLLQKEVFQGEICPPELRDVGFRIAKSCGGLPLFIVLVSGILKEKKKQVGLWKEVEERLNAHNVGSLGESMPIIGFSYKNLPDYLKPCFLYFGGLVKGKDIHVSKLTQLWVSEGFVQAQEDAAQDFLEDLISRNLLMSMKKRPNGKVKMCRVHDILHQFCLETSEQENFLLRIDRFSGEDTFPQKPKEYRLFVHSSQDQIDMWQPSFSNARSLILSVIDLDSLLWPLDISFIFESFKLVKVLDLELCNIGGTFPSEIKSLVHLRYFAIQTDANSIPSSIAKLWNLETFVVRGLGGEVILPSSLLNMVKLRHIIVKHRASFSLNENVDESFANSQLENLETFSTPRLSYGEDAETILRKMPNLRKLSCIFLGKFGYSEEVKGRCVLFPRLEFLSHLESLKLVSNSCPAKLQHEFNFPSRLRELTLSKFRLPWSQIAAIGELPNLEILKLLLRAFEGEHWEVKDSEFPELKYLKLDNLNIRQWSFSEDAFPKLEHLVLTKCERLMEIPSQFGDSISLQSIEVSWCSNSAANSAQEIKTTQHEDYGRSAFTVTIQSSS